MFIDFSNIVTKGPKGDPGPIGPQGAQGEPFIIYKLYASIDLMNADAENVPDGKFVLISNDNVEDPDNARLYVKSGEAFNYLTDLSGSQGIQGPEGPAGPQGDPGSVDTSNLAKLDGQNTFTGYDNTFNNRVTFEAEIVMAGGGQSTEGDIASGIACAFKCGRSQSIDNWCRNIHTGTDGEPLRIVSSGAEGSTQYAKIDSTGIYEGETLLSDKYASKSYVDEKMGAVITELKTI